MGQGLRPKCALSSTAAMIRRNKGEVCMNQAFLERDKSIHIAPCPPQAPRAGQVRLRVAYCGICGTDLHIYRGHMDQRVQFPQVIGHEMSGRIAEIGPGVDGLMPGDPVVVRPLAPCGKCPACRAGHEHICYQLNFIGIDSPGAFQASWTVPAATIHKLPEDTDLKLAALVEPLAVACHDNRLAAVGQGQMVAVLGGGPIGLLNAMVARHRGAEVILSEVNPARLALARRLGFKTIDPTSENLKQSVEEHTDGTGADVVFEVSGAPSSLAAMTGLARSRGRIVIVAIVPEPQPVNLFEVFWRELVLVGTRVYEVPDYDYAIELVASGQLDLEPLITAELPLNRLADAFSMLDRDATQMKVMIDCGGTT